jgi:tungstate transport system ATP-binding protein
MDPTKRVSILKPMRAQNDQGIRGDGALLSIRNLVIYRNGGFRLEVGSLDIYPKETLAIIGPNGAGKSTLLLVLSRLLPPLSGTINFHGSDLNTLNELDYRRRIALVLQEPHLFNTSVFNNVATGLRFRKTDSREIEKRAGAWLKRLRIDHLKDRHASTLSGGEAQRVNLARALVLEPELLFLDEPFGALDTQTRRSLMEDLRHILYETGTCTVFITHSQDEALYFGDRIAVLLDGVLRQVGTPQTIFSNPTDERVAEFVGVENVLAGKVHQIVSGRVGVEIDGVSFEVVGEFPIGQRVLFCLRPEDITLWPEPSPQKSSARNQVTGQVTAVVPLGPLVRVTVDCGIPIIAMVTRASASDLELKVGSKITLSFKASAIHLIPKT